MEAQYVSRQTELDEALLSMDIWFGLIEKEEE
jgi:hypothetical protein